MQEQHKIKMLHFAAAVQVWYITGIKEEESFQANKYCNREEPQRLSLDYITTIPN
jgi:hypothetical protein